MWSPRTLVVAPLIIWLRERRLPVWAYLPLGMLLWFLIRWLQFSVVTTVVPQATRVSIDLVIVLLMLAIATAMLTVLLRGRSVPAAAYAVIALLLLSGLLLGVVLSRTSPWSYRTLQRPMMVLAAALEGPAIALLLVATGLPAARRHNVLALLVLIGGYGTVFGDNDYLWGSPMQEWPGLPFYLVGMTILFFVLAPAGLLRAKTRLGQVTAVFLPAAIFLAARIAVPVLILGPAKKIYPGDALLSATVLLSLILGWIRYGRTADKELPAPSF